MFNRQFRKGDRSIPLNELPGDKLTDFAAASSTMAVQELETHLLSFLKKLCEYNHSQERKVILSDILDHINTCYTQDLYLESLADRFGTSPKYLSKLLKQKLGIGFQEYLAMVRISSAKVLLAETKKSISEIEKETGFNNRYTFIRLFKKLEGITPSEYREQKCR